jgi:hypothetical protein
MVMEFYKEAECSLIQTCLDLSLSAFQYDQMSEIYYS